MLQGVCFVVQGFGEKTDYTNGRKLNLDASYAVIREAVIATGLRCVRADEIGRVGTGMIDVPMYQNLLRADLVIADLSAYNVNAAFELGVRYGLRPHATIIVAEDQFANPFDVSHIVIRRYKHLGEDIGVSEAKRFHTELVDAINAILAAPKTDSPVYVLLSQLRPPMEELAPAQPPSAAPSIEAPPAVGAPTSFAAADAPSAPPSPSPSPFPTSSPTGDTPNCKQLLETALAAIDQSDFCTAKSQLERLLPLRPNDHFVVHKLALATYKSKQPDVKSALDAAKKLLEPLQPASTNDPETLGLWGAIHKRLWDIAAQRTDLDESISAYSRGYFLKQDFYTGINRAYLLNVRAVEFLKSGDTEEALADMVLARRTRRDILGASDTAVAEFPESSTGRQPWERRYWVMATLWEAAVGLEDEAAAAQWETRTKALPAADWMRESTESQLASLRALLKQVRLGMSNMAAASASQMSDQHCLAGLTRA
jgi:tetratricopeptide (TPR) repeat protein